MKVSIITINYNNKAGLQKSLNSVVHQSSKNLEFIVIDGGSSDGSAEILKKESSKIDYWVSEKDNGIYHAMNKGILKANGEYLLFLNSGDFLVNAEIIESVIPLLHGSAVIYGNQLIDEALDTYPDRLTFGYFFNHGTLPHQAAFIRKELFNKYGLYNESLKICADTVFFMKVLCKYNETYKHINVPISQINLNGMSAQPQNWKVIQSEIQQAIKEDFSMFVEDYSKMKEINGMLTRSRMVKTLKQIGFLKQLKS